MKTITKTGLSLQMTVMFLTATLAGDAAAQGPSPFHGSLEAIETHVPNESFTILFAKGSGKGNATHLGRFTVDFEAEINLLTGVGIGSAHFIAANGDSLFTETIGQGNPTENPSILLVVETYTITAGTGRFAGASGSFTMDRLADLVTGFTSGSFSGSIVLSKGN